MSAATIGFLLGVPVGALALYVLNTLQDERRRRRGPMPYDPPRRAASYAPVPPEAAPLAPPPEAVCRFCGSPRPDEWFPRGWTAWREEGQITSACGGCSIDHAATIRVRRVKEP